MKNRFILIMGIITGMLLFHIVFAKDKEQEYFRNFWDPVYDAHRLAYCAYHSKKCGMHVANEYCKIMGFEKANKEIKDNNVGLTNFLLTKATCKGWQCDGFKLIRCAGHISHEPPAVYYYQYRKFTLPRFGHYRVDWCYEKGTACGKRVAQSFCRRMGYLKTIGFMKQSHVPATSALGDQKLCFGNQCQAFKEINCAR